MLPLLHKAIDVYSQIRDEIQAGVSAAKQIDKGYGNFAASQVHYYSERCQSLNLLLQEWKLWDCDILMRAALECATRFIFVSIAEPVERANRILEYTESLFEIDDLQRSAKAMLASAASSNADAVRLLGGVALSAQREAELRARWPKAERAALKQKWSFSEMVREISSFHAGPVDLREYKSLLHSYGQSSHLIHADQTAIGLLWDRARRKPHERQALEAAHFARLATEQVSVFFLCWRVLAYATGVDPKGEAPIRNLLLLHKEADVFLRAFAETQPDLHRGSRSE